MTIEPLVGGTPAPAPDPYRSMFPNSERLFTEPAAGPAPVPPIGRPVETAKPAPAAEADPAKLAFPNSPGLWQKPEQPAPTCSKPQSSAPRIAIIARACPRSLQRS